MTFCMAVLHFKGTASRDFLFLVFFHESVSPSPRVSHFFLKFAEIFAGQGAPPVSTTQAAKYQDFQ
jgi:hypothetical protein